MKFLSAAILGLVASTAQAFSPKNFVPQPGSGVLVPGSSENTDSGLWRPPMNMVAGGAERAYGQEYYEGKTGKTKGGRQASPAYLDVPELCDL